jgi:hypothetical protein
MNTSKYFLKIAICALPVLLGTTWCLSQTYDFYGGGYGGYPYVNNQATTVGQSYAQGMSDVIRSKGAANLMNSQAAINATQAQSNEIKNREQWTTTYFQMRKENKTARAEERGPNPTAEDLVRYAQMGKPKSMGPNQLDAVSGKIYWPPLLLTDQFASSRQELDDIFAKRARYGDISMDDIMNIRNATNKMLDQLKEGISALPPSQYMSAKQFLVSLAYEVQLVAG